MPLYRVVKLIVSVVITACVGGIGYFFTAPVIATWYMGLEKPTFTPPNWAFGLVWTILFFLMGIALFLFWEKRSTGASQLWRIGLELFFLQLLLNILWTVLFFGILNPKYALGEMVILGGAILFTVIVFYKFSRAASWCLVPYLSWVAFAVYLNWGIVLLNS